MSYKEVFDKELTCTILDELVYGKFRQVMFNFHIFYLVYVYFLRGILLLTILLTCCCAVDDIVDSAFAGVLPLCSVAWSRTCSSVVGL